MTTNLHTAANRELLHEIIEELLTTKHINLPKFFTALELLHDIAKDCNEKCEQMQRANAALQQQNNQLAWLALYQIKFL